MNREIFEILLGWPKSYISGVDLHNILDKSPNSRYSIIKRAVQKGYLTPIRRDLYLINNPKHSLPNSFEIAPIIYGPSYISFESSLSFHGWIPEGVRTTTCATIKRSKEFETPIGIYSYEHVPAEAFHIGVAQRVHNKATFFIANPLKAITDMIYSRKLNWTSIENLSEDLRIEPENLARIDKKLLTDLIKTYPSTRVKKTLCIFEENL